MQHQRIQVKLTLYCVFSILKRQILRELKSFPLQKKKQKTGTRETRQQNSHTRERDNKPQTPRYGVADRGASIRIPVSTVEDGWKGRLEDRRPASNADPYKVASIIVKVTKEALDPEAMAA